MWMKVVEKSFHAIIIENVVSGHPGGSRYIMDIWKLSDTVALWELADIW